LAAKFSETLVFPCSSRFRSIPGNFDKNIFSVLALPASPVETAPAMQAGNEVSIPFAPPLIGEDEIAEVADTLRSNWITTGPKTKRFEAAFAQQTGAPEALALSSCTAGLHLALLANGIGPGDEVITSTVTFAATVNVIEHVGARPVLVDVEPDTLNLCPGQVARSVTERTKAILVVHYAGHPADLDALEAIAEQHQLKIIEDAAHAIPARYKGRMIGSGLNPTSFSFYATKNLATGEGGMLTGDPETLSRARTLSLHGMSRDAWRRYDQEGSWFYDIIAPGFKYNMTDIQASLGLHQLKRLASFQTRRKEIVDAYHDAFEDIEAFQLPVCRQEVEHAWHLYVLRLSARGSLSIGRDQFIEELKSRGVATSVHFIPIHLHSYYRDKYGYQPEDFPVAFDNFQRMLSLPLSPALTEGQVSRVIEAVREVVHCHSRKAAA